MWRKGNVKCFRPFPPRRTKICGTRKVIDGIKTNEHKISYPSGIIRARRGQLWKIPTRMAGPPAAAASCEENQLGTENDDRHITAMPPSQLPDGTCPGKGRARV